jgi:2-polyprenyl-3-methyl-5-hydroxy-6-metoxy-1,4-benzoquinol methylase
MSVSRKEHWEHVYESKGPTELSWYQPVPSASLALIRATGVSPEAPIIDVGAGVSSLVDELQGSGHSNITVVDIANAAIGVSRARLGDAASSVKWISADVLEWVPKGRYYIWHDRAVFHFLVDEASARTYLDTMRAALVPGGYFILATFGPEGPERCSGLAVQRYSIDMLTGLLGRDFELQSHELEDHTTPTGNVQQFLYSCWRMTG